MLIQLSNFLSVLYIILATILLVPMFIKFKDNKERHKNILLFIISVLMFLNLTVMIIVNIIVGKNIIIAFLGLILSMMLAIIHYMK